MVSPMSLRYITCWDCSEYSGTPPMSPDVPVCPFLFNIYKHMMDIVRILDNPAWKCNKGTISISRSVTDQIGFGTHRDSKGTYELSPWLTMKSLEKYGLGTGGTCIRGQCPRLSLFTPTSQGVLQKGLSDQ